MVETVRPFVDHLDAHRGQRRQHLREGDRGTAPEHLEPSLAASRVEGREQGEVGATLAEGFEPAEVQGAGGRREVLLVGLGERALEVASQRGADLLAELGDGGGHEVVAP